MIGTRAPGWAVEYGSYFQSERLPLYHAEAERLIAQGDAYRCYCTRERLAELRTRQEREKSALGYDGPLQAPGRRGPPYPGKVTRGAPFVVRFAMPDTGITHLHDLIRDDVEWQNELVDDFVLLKSDSFPYLSPGSSDRRPFHGDKPRTEGGRVAIQRAPRHLQLYRALGYEPPEHGHLPMILGPDRAKLSKRHGATSILEYRDDGFLPEALSNFMVLLGWSLDDKTEVMPVETIVDNFTLDRVGKPAAIFDRDKLSWMNGVYIREMSAAALADAMGPFLEKGLPSPPAAGGQGLLV